MDLITHSLAGTLIAKLSKEKKRKVLLASLFGATIPDIGEIPIQAALSNKYGSSITIYDLRTSDLSIANDLDITFLYDITHSLLMCSIIFLLAIVLFLLNKKITLRIVLLYFSFGLLSHILLDSFTHGKVWALKLLFPLSQQRFLILDETLGSWWDWKPNLIIPHLGIVFPYINIMIWILFLISFSIINKVKN